MMHAGLQHRFPMERNPESDRSRPGQIRQDVVREVVGRLLGREVEIGEDDDPGDRMLEDLGAPAGVGPGVEPLAQHEPQPREDRDQSAGKYCLEQRNV